MRIAVSIRENELSGKLSWGASSVETALFAYYEEGLM